MRANKADIKIGGVDYTNNLSLPFVIQDSGTEQLDSAVISLVNMRTEAKFPPFTPVSLCKGKYTYLVADDSVKAVFGRSVWNHELTLIDETKATERILMEGKSFTQPLIQTLGDAKDADGYKFINNTLSGTDSTHAKVAEVQTPIHVDGGAAVIHIPSPRTMVSLLGGLYGYTWGIKILYNKGMAAYDDTADVYDKVYEATNVSDYDFTAEVNVTKTGIYTIEYKVDYNTGIGSPETARYIIPIAVYNAADAPQPYSIYDVMEITLQTSFPLLEGETPRYSLELTDEQEARFKCTTAPEMHFANGRSLYENLQEIGDVIHCIPRVKNFKVRWQEIGTREKADLSSGAEYGGTSQYNAADYATEIESNFANLINSDEAEGSVTNPYKDGFITLRSNEYRITEETSYIPTDYQIGTKLIKVLARIHNNDASHSVATTIDITPAVFEKHEYDALSSFSGIYPFSKTHALYYTTWQKNIEGLWYRAQDATIGIMNQFERYAITNVLNFFGGRDESEYDYNMLSFQVTYIPFVNGRARQARVEDIGGGCIVLAHNQSANELSAKAFGENLRGKIAMLANPSESKNYVFKRIEDVPIGGLLYDNKRYISNVTTRIFPDYCISQIDLAQNYNNAGAFVQLKTGIRQYEIPAGQDRNTLIEEYCEIGKRKTSAEQEADNVYMLCTETLKKKVLSAFGANPTASDITTAYIQTRDENHNDISGKIALPVYSTSLGTSVYLGFTFEDNFSAGKQATPLLQNAMGTEYVEYGSKFYGRAKYLSFSLCDGYTGDSRLKGTSVPHRLPAAWGVEPVNEYVKTDKAMLLWNKDAADRGAVAYQLHFCSNDGYVITSEFAKQMPFVRTSAPGRVKAYFYKREIDELTGDAQGDPFFETYVTVHNDDGVNGWYIEMDELPIVTYKSFAVKQEGKNVCIFGKNTTNADKRIYFNFKRKR